MARYLCAVWPFSGHVNPMLAVAGALRVRGHEVAFYTGEAARATVEGEGHSFFPFDRVAARLREIVDGVPGGRAGDDDEEFYWRLVARYAPAYEHRGLARSRLLRAMSREWILGTVPAQVADLDAILDQWRPDAIICDPTLWAPYLVLHEARKVPVAVFAFFAGCMIPGPDAPPPGLGLPRPRNWTSRLISRAATLTMDVGAADLRRVASKLRQQYGLPPLADSVAAHSGRMPLHLVATSPAYDYDRRDLPPSVQYVGACLWDKPSRHDPPAWLSDLPDDQPVVYVTDGTLPMRTSSLLPAAAAGLADLPLRAVLTTSRQRDPAALGLSDVAPNIRVERFVPHSDLFPRLSAVVTTGGSGTVRAALAAGLPLVIAPMGWDQFDNARRVAEAGAGLRLPAHRLTPERLRSAVRQVLVEPSFAANARRLGAASARLGGPAHAAELLERLALQPEQLPAGVNAYGEHEPAPHGVVGSAG